LVRREALLWLKAAEEDLEDAHDALGRRRWFRAAFFSHQAVEKALKALFFVILRRDPPKTHVISDLYRELRGAGFQLPGEVDTSIHILNKYYTITRYPDAANGLPSEAVDEVEARRAVELARRVYEEVRRAVESAT